MSLGLDELMIVNPAAGGLSAMFFGRDGGLYGVEDRHPAAGEGGGYFLGEDGGLYRLDSPTIGDSSRFFLGGDGTLYQRVAARPR
jgi:hypothetical protein